MTTITVKGMKCQHCAESSKKALEAIEGISAVTVDLNKGQIDFAGSVDPEMVRVAITKVGFEVVV